MDKKKNFKVVIGVIAVLVCGIIYITANYRQGNKEVVTEQFSDVADTGRGNPKLTEEPSGTDQENGVMYIHICGEVKNPGVYIFSLPPRLVEVVEKAGGFTKKADRSAVNLAESVTDGSQITIPSKKRRESGEKNEVQNTSSEGKVNINTASREELMTLNGIGESKASQIISYRETNGLFKKIDDIMNISGIKEGVFNKIKDYIIVS